MAWTGGEELGWGWGTGWGTANFLKGTGLPDLPQQDRGRGQGARGRTQKGVEGRRGQGGMGRGKGTREQQRVGGQGQGVEGGQRQGAGGRERGRAGWLGLGLGWRLGWGRAAGLGAGWVRGLELEAGG